MKINTVHLFYSIVCILVFLLFGFTFSTTSQTVDNFQIKKKIIAHLSNLVFIEEGTFTMGSVQSHDIRLTELDSTLFSNVIPRRVKLSSFYLNSTEITNDEWRAYYMDMALKIGDQEAKKKCYPDTSLWNSEFPYSYNIGYVKHYFSMQEFKDYPVVGITWEQASDYCHWRTNKLSELLARKGVKSTIEFRLPSEAEWEYAAVKAPDPMSSLNSNSERIKLLANLNSIGNIGKVYDYNKILLKSYTDDGCLYTCPVASYKPNSKGVFDMFGNVSEWTANQGHVKVYDHETKRFKTLNSREEINIELDSIRNDNNLDDYLKEKNLASLSHDKNILKKDSIKICKGGSWADGLIYSLPSSRQGIEKNKASSKIGFRVAVSNFDQNMDKYLPKKK